MIDHVLTLSLKQADEWLLNNMPPKGYRDEGLPWAWIGFESPGADWSSPLHHSRVRSQLIVPMNDIDPDARRGSGEYGPSLRVARRIVDFVLQLQKSRKRYALVLHCHAGLYRSGAVAEWVTQQFDVPEDEVSHRIAVFGAKHRSFNRTLYRMLNEACAERPDCGRRA